LHETVKLGHFALITRRTAFMDGTSGKQVSTSGKDNLRTVQQNYEAFGRGDIDLILESLALDVHWEYHPTGNTAQDSDIPYMRFRKGKENVPGFFEDMEKNYEMHTFEPQAFLEGDGFVAVLVKFELTVKSTGKRIRDEEIHLFEFNPEGKIKAFRHFLDSKKTIEAHQ
jgi:ketosteroid isomerase-like protein